MSDILAIACINLPCVSECMYVCMYVRMYACTHACMHVCMYDEPFLSLFIFYINAWSYCFVCYLFSIVFLEVNYGVIRESFPRTTEQITVATS